MAFSEIQHDRLMAVLEGLRAQADETIVDAGSARRRGSRRAINDRIADLEGAWRSSEPVGFVCECSDGACASPVYLAVSEYLEIRTDPSRFLALPEHVDPDRESVVRSTGRYAVVVQHDQR